MIQSVLRESKSITQPALMLRSKSRKPGRAWLRDHFPFGPPAQTLALRIPSATTVDVPYAKRHPTTPYRTTLPPMTHHGNAREEDPPQHPTEHQERQIVVRRHCLRNGANLGHQIKLRGVLPRLQEPCFGEY